MRRSITLIILIGIVVSATLGALMTSSAITSSLYNQIWLSEKNDPPECLMRAPVENCEKTDAEYFDGFVFWSNVVQFSIVGAGVVIGVKLCKSKTLVRKD